MKVSEFGVVLGRFQPIHLGHVEYLESAKSRCDRLIVGVTNPNINALGNHASDPNRFLLVSNPFSYFFRHELISKSLLEIGLDARQFGIVPADLEDLSTLTQFLPSIDRTTIFVTVYDQWGDEKFARLQALGFKVEILWRRDMSERLTSGTEIRSKIRLGEEWEGLVPKSVASTIKRLSIIENSSLLSHENGGVE